MTWTRITQDELDSLLAKADRLEASRDRWKAEAEWLRRELEEAMGVDRISQMRRERVNKRLAAARTALTPTPPPADRPEQEPPHA